ncbi:MAG: hypothetical protein WB422_15195, partial [Pseudolabrys sp.]
SADSAGPPRAKGYRFTVFVVRLNSLAAPPTAGPYKSGPSKAWLKIKNLKAPATRAIEGTF